MKTSQNPNPSHRYDFSNGSMNQTRLRPHPLNAEIYGDSKPDAALVESIRHHGILNPIIVDRQKQILSGTRRWLAAKEIGYTSVPVITLLNGVNVKDKVDDSAHSKLVSELFLVESNKARTKTEAQKDAEAAALLRIEKELAAERQQAGVRLNPSEGGKAVEKVAAITGESPDTVRKRAKIHEEKIPPPERNKVSTNAAFKELSNREKRRRAFVQQYPEFTGKPNKEIDSEVHRRNFIAPEYESAAPTTPAPTVKPSVKRAGELSMLFGNGLVQWSRNTGLYVLRLSRLTEEQVVAHSKLVLDESDQSAREEAA